MHYFLETNFQRYVSSLIIGGVCRELLLLELKYIYMHIMVVAQWLNKQSNNMFMRDDYFYSLCIFYL